jgi:transcriptional activator of cad operon
MLVQRGHTGAHAAERNRDNYGRLGRVGIVSIDDLLNQVWSGVVVTQDSVYQGVASLRRLLGDDAKEPAYIATVPRLGYRMVAKVSPWVDESLAAGLPPAADAPVIAASVEPSVSPSRRASILIVVIGALGLALVVAFQFHATDANRPRPGVTGSAPPPRSATVADMAASLGVAYVLDGSIRKSDATLRVSVRLIRAADGYVVWSETYDRPEGDKPGVQKDIASEVTKALPASIQ